MTPAQIATTLHPLSELGALAQGNGHFQLLLAEKLKATGRPVHELTVAEALAVCHDAIIAFEGRS